jgi:hypothetical protein
MGQPAAVSVDDSTIAPFEAWKSGATVPSSEPFAWFLVKKLNGTPKAGFRARAQIAKLTAEELNGLTGATSVLAFDSSIVGYVNEALAGNAPTKI